MKFDFHYYATYCAAYIAGYSYSEALQIANSATFVDYCSKTLLGKCNAPKNAATVQTNSELLDTYSTLYGVQEMTRIWASFHFLPGDLSAKVKNASKPYLHKYQLICRPNGKLLLKTVNLVKDTSLEGIGLAMHVLADTWAHQYFAGTPSLVINDINDYFYEIINVNGKEERRKIHFSHKPSAKDDLEHFVYANTFHSNEELSIMNLGHGRVGHLPDFSYIKYVYLPSWGNYQEVIKDNPSDFMSAFKQMVYALKCYKNGQDFLLNQYDEESVAPYEDMLHELFIKRQTNCVEDWKKISKQITGQEIPNFSISYFTDEYINSSVKEETRLAKFMTAAIDQKSMVTSEIFSTGSLLAGYSRVYDPNRKTLKDRFEDWMNHFKRGHENE